MGRQELPLGAEQIVILVVGDDTESKSRIADRAAMVHDASLSDTTSAGVRIFTSASDSKTIVDTTKLFPPVVEGDLSQERKQQLARQWISQNSLRRLLLGKILRVVCVLSYPKNCEVSLAAYKESFGWLDILGVMFPEHKETIQMLVNTQHIEQTKLKHAAKNIEIVLKQHGFPSSNTKYLNWSREGDELSAQLRVEDCVELDDSTGQLETSTSGDSVHSEEGPPLPKVIDRAFLLLEPASPRKPISTPWGPERVILFGRTGSGKSTLAQMLTQGRLDPQSKVFASSSGCRGETKQVSVGHGRGWYVVDTPGFGEPNRTESTIPTQVAEDKIKKFVKTIDGLYTHFLFVVKKDRIDELEVRLWRFFVCLFGHNEINDHFSIVITNADEEWVNVNQTYLKDLFKGCSSFLCAEFPSSHPSDDEWEEELQEIRMESLKRMEDELASLSRSDIVCEFGDLSKTAIMKKRGHYQGHGLEDIRHNASILVMKIFATMSCLTGTLTVDQDIALLPF